MRILLETLTSRMSNVHMINRRYFQIEAIGGEYLESVDFLQQSIRSILKRIEINAVNSEQKFLRCERNGQFKLFLHFEWKATGTFFVSGSETTTQIYG